MSHDHTFIEQLRRRGYRITPQREMIIETLAHAPDHLTAEQIFAQVGLRSGAVNLATIYRTLDMLVDEGLATRVALHDGQTVYTSNLHGPHIHLVCRRCGGAWAVEPGVLAVLVEQLRQEHHFVLDLQHLSLTGLCSLCLATEVL